MSRYRLRDALEDALQVSSRLPTIWRIWHEETLYPHLREEVMVAVAAAVGCPYCTFSHREMILQSGESLVALADFEQVDVEPRYFAAIIWAQAKVEASFGVAPPAIESSLRSTFTPEECHEIETVAIAMWLMSSCGHQADNLVERLNGSPQKGSSLGNELLMAAIYFPPALAVYFALAARRGSSRSLADDFRAFSENFQDQRRSGDGRMQFNESESMGSQIQPVA